MKNIILSLDAELIEGKTPPQFCPGDILAVQIKVTEGTRERLHTFEGVVIAKRNRGLSSAFTVRKISHSVPYQRCTTCKTLFPSSRNDFQWYSSCERKID